MFEDLERFDINHFDSNKREAITIISCSYTLNLNY